MPNFPHALYALELFETLLATEVNELEGHAQLARGNCLPDIAKLAAAMARGDMPYASGQAIYVDGGLTMNRL